MSISNRERWDGEERVALSDGSSKVQRPSKMLAKQKMFDLI